MQKRRILATSALPYANGSIHIGHLVEYLQTDFWVRFQKMRGHEAYYICADDTHGTPIMVAARKDSITPEQLIEQKWQEHVKDFTDFQIEFSHYSSTNSNENRILCEEFFSHIVKKNHLSTKVIQQLYCDHDKMFLPDRFVKGTCPNCGSPDQYGDSCDKCSATYAPTDLKNPGCSICGRAPVMKDSEHLLFKLNDFKEFLRTVLPKITAKDVANKMMEWFTADLRDWDISRDDPYFGFKIPGHPGKYFYVWVDAPMGYISSSQQYFKKTKNESAFKDFWKNDKDTEVYHFIGKDIVYFHTLFWPALLKTAEYRLPNQVFVHGMLTVNGVRMSKSKGTRIAARTFLNHVDPTVLRYYFASKMSGNSDDLDLNLEELVSKFNSDLVGKITNLGSRGAQMLGKKLDGKMTDLDTAGLDLVQRAQATGEKVAQYFENRDFNKGLVEIRSLADDANRYFDDRAPWKTLEKDPTTTKQILTSTLNLFRILAIYLKPILPRYAARVEELFGESNYTWASSTQILRNHAIKEYTHLATRIELATVNAMVEESRKAEEEKTMSASTTPEGAKPATPAEIEITDFDKVDLRIAKIISAEAVPEADKLLKLQVDLGPLGQRQIFAGIKAAYKPETLVGRLTVVVANLKPRKMKFGMSEGMVLAAGRGGAELFILSPDSGALPGERAK